MEPSLVTMLSILDKYPPLGFELAAYLDLAKTHIRSENAMAIQFKGGHLSPFYLFLCQMAFLGRPINLPQPEIHQQRYG